MDKFPYKGESEGDFRLQSGRCRHTEEKSM